MPKTKITYPCGTVRIMEHTSNTTKFHGLRLKQHRPCQIDFDQLPSDDLIQRCYTSLGKEGKLTLNGESISLAEVQYRLDLANKKPGQWVSDCGTIGTTPFQIR